MRQNDTERHLSRLEAELLAGTGGIVRQADIREAVRQALRDLAGSVHRDSLPEMASRLAAARLRHQPSQGWEPKVPVGV
jgi:hypothetical protein